MKIKLHAARPHARFMPSCQWLGTVTDSGQTGTLMLTAEGRYCIVQRGEARALDADAVAIALAEAMSRSPGRPVSAEGRMSMYSVNLSTSDVERARKLGEGNLSAGLREALRAYVFPTDGS